MRPPRMCVYRGKRVSFPDLSRDTGLSAPALAYRIFRLGLTPEQAVEMGPSRRRIAKLHTDEVTGETHTSGEWSDRTGMSHQLLNDRFKRMSVHEAVSLPVRKGVCER